MLGEAFSFRSEAQLSAIMFLITTLLAGFANWWTARMMLEFEWRPPLPATGRFIQIRDWLRKYWPRVVGIAPVVIVAGALFLRVLDYSTGGSLGAQQSLFWLGVWHLIGAVALFFFFKLRRWLVGKDTGKSFRNFSERDAYSTESRIVNLGLFIISGLIFLSVWAAPQSISVRLGTGAMFSLAAVAWVTVGTRLMFLRARTGFPVISGMIVWVFLNSCWMDNHAIRLSPGNHALAAGPTVRDAFDTWMLSTHASESPAELGECEPLFIVATEGGGIRAAYWTASVLGAFQWENNVAGPEQAQALRKPDFSTRLFAISGVSGGSVGAAVFDALLADHVPNIWASAGAILGRDHLAPLMGGLLFPDAFQRIFPVPLGCTDRAAMLERSWEEAYRRKVGTDRLSEPFRGLFSTAMLGKMHLPHLFLNCTMVETGQRVIFSDLAITGANAGGEFLDAIDARAVLFSSKGGSVVPLDVALSTAAHASARFTYTNPAGLLSTGQRIVDGGYFENSGSVTAMEILAVVEHELAIRPKSTNRIVPVLIIISNDPQRRANGGKVTWVSDQQIKSQAALGQALPSPVIDHSSDKRASPEFEESKPLQFASELLSPPRALMGTRSARGTLALQQIIDHQRGAKTALEAELKAALERQGKKPPQEVEKRPNLISIHLHDEGVPLPLGWSLSEAAAGDMQRQLWADEELAQARAYVKEWMRPKIP